MNDCVWLMTGVCEGDKCRCNQYNSANSRQGGMLLKEWGYRVEDALKPVREIFAVAYGFKKEETINE